MITRLLILTLCFGLISCVENAETSKGNGIVLKSLSAPDPLAPYLWHLNPVTVPYVNNVNVTSPFSHINLSNIHDSYQGRGVTIVVSDDHAQLDHPDLRSNADLGRSKNYVIKAGSIYLTKTTGPYFGNPFFPELHTKTHGTNVAGPAMATKSNGVGGFGVAPGAKLVNYNFLLTDMRKSIQIDQLKIAGGNSVFNFSYGPLNDRFFTGIVGDLSAEAADEFLNELNHQVVFERNVYVQASGNEFNLLRPINHSFAGTRFFGNANFTQLSTNPQIIVVGATNASGLSASYSTPGSNVWISAPGGDITTGLMTPDIVGCNKGNAADPNTTSEFDLGQMLGIGLNADCSHYSSGAGTSFAAPVVSGVIALMKEANPRLSWREIKMLLAITARKIDPLNSGSNHPTGLNLAGHQYQQGWVTNSSGLSFHPWYGFGLVDAKRAVEAARNYNQANTFEAKVTRDFDDNSLYSRSHGSPLAIPDNNAGGASSSITIGSHHLFVEHVKVKVNITHPRPSDVGLLLTSPGGTTSNLMNINSQITGTDLLNVSFGANGFFGERSVGVWTLTLVDGSAGFTGTLNNWSIEILGNRGESFSTDTTPPVGVTGLSFNRSTSTLSWTPVGDAMRYEVCIFEAATAFEEGEENICMDTDWRPVLANSIVVSHFFEQGRRKELETDVLYFAFVRAVDSAENESAKVELGFLK